MPVSIGYISYQQTREIADDFLKKHHPTLSLPIPIEEIADLKLRINIVPLPGLVKDFKSFGAECLGFISSDLQTIFIDYHIWELHNLTYRSTLAHEIGHMILHKEHYENRPFHDVEDFKSFVNDMQQEGSGLTRFEIQANNFAGLVLVPYQKLVEVMDRLIPDFKARLKSSGLKNVSEDEAWEFFCEKIAKEFEVSPHIIARRIEFQQLKKKYKLP